MPLFVFFLQVTHTYTFYFSIHPFVISGNTKNILCIYFLTFLSNLPKMRDKKETSIFMSASPVIFCR